MVHEHRGEPDGLVVSHMPYGPTAYFGIFNTVRPCRHMLFEALIEVCGCCAAFVQFLCLFDASVMRR